MHEHGEAGQPSEERRGGVLRVAGRSVPPPGPDAGRAAVRRRPRGPRPVRPPVVAVAVRPAQVQRPVCRSLPRRPGQRVLVRRWPAGAPAGLPARLRRAVAGLALAMVAAAAVVGLGTLADVAAQSRAPASAPTVTVVTAGPGETVWEVARRVAPAASGPELAAVADRIATTNALPSMRLHAGQVLRVTAG